MGAAGSVPIVPGSLVEIVEHERRFPAVVERMLAERHAEMLTLAGAMAGTSGTGRVLDLDDATSRVLLAAVIDHDAAHPIEPTWDAVVSAGELVRFPDLAAALHAIDRILVPTGRLLAVEPVARPGTLRMFVDAPFTAARATRGFHIGRDLLAALRTTTLVADDIERFTVRTSLPTLRHFVAVDARRAVPRQEST